MGWRSQVHKETVAEPRMSLSCPAWPLCLAWSPIWLQGFRLSRSYDTRAWLPLQREQLRPSAEPQHLTPSFVSKTLYNPVGSGPIL